MQTRNRNLKVKLVFNGIIFSSLFIMGMQFTPFRFMDKEALIGPLIILTAILIYYLIFNREIIITKNSLLIAALSALFFMYYIANITA
ncbi:hypothetical protein J4G37_59620, partial [Microvirga sp. 3-52]|nr:hypothetical protein [Microvirga sp. 3-52]